MKKIVLSILCVCNISQAGLFEDFIDFFDIGGVFPSLFEETIIEEGFKKFTGDIANNGDALLETCYQYTPTSPDLSGNREISIDVCQALEKLPDLCEYAPDLSAVGYSKKTYTWDIKAGCEKLVEDKVIKPISEYMGATDFNIEMFNMESNDTSETSNKIRYSYKESVSNKYLAHAIKTNDVKTATIINNIIASTDSTSAKLDTIDIAKLNVPYKTIADYEKSVNEQVVGYRTIEEQMDTKRIKKMAYTIMKDINANYELDETDGSQAKRSKAKLEAKSKILEEYAEVIDKYTKMKIKQRMLLEYMPAVLDPTQGYVKRFQEEDRASVIYTIEKQKAVEASIVMEEKQKADALMHKIETEVQKSIYATEELNEVVVIQSIKKIIKKQESSIEDLIDNAIKEFISTALSNIGNSDSDSNSEDSNNSEDNNQTMPEGCPPAECFQDYPFLARPPYCPSELEIYPMRERCGF